jgi:hypothetical protein
MLQESTAMNDRPANHQVTRERLKELLHYSPETGAWTYLISRSRNRAGSPAGFTSKVNTGVDVLRIKIDGVQYTQSHIEFRWNRRGPFINRLFTLFGTNHGPLPLKALFA